MEKTTAKTIKSIPSLMDLHVHFREPGYCHKETILTGILSARNGGFSAVCTMPNTLPVCDNPDVIKEIIDKAKKYDFEIYPVAAITKNLDSLELVNFKELKAFGAVAFSNDGLPLRDKEVFLNALKQGELIMSHCEDETEEVKEQIELFKEAKKQGFNPKLHFCHISKKQSVELIRNAKKQGLNVTCQSAPHYFTFTIDDIDSTGRFKMNPPLGTAEDKKAIIEGIMDGTIDCIATDHAPHTNEEKLLPYDLSPNGITGLETAFSLTYMTFGLDITIEKLSLAPRRILNIKNNKTINVALDETWIVKGENFKSKCKITPYENMTLKGKVINEQYN